jgi:hypothetical protein
MPEATASVTATLAGKKVAAEAVLDYVHAGRRSDRRSGALVFLGQDLVELAV